MKKNIKVIYGWTALFINLILFFLISFTSIFTNVKFIGIIPSTFLYLMIFVILAYIILGLWLGRLYVEEVKEDE